MFIILDPPKFCFDTPPRAAFVAVFIVYISSCFRREFFNPLLTYLPVSVYPPPFISIPCRSPFSLFFALLSLVAVGLLSLAKEFLGSESADRHFGVRIILRSGLFCRRLLACSCFVALVFRVFVICLLKGMEELEPTRLFLGGKKGCVNGE